MIEEKKCMYEKNPRRKRLVTTITLDPKVLKKAKEHNLNISRLSEEALREKIKKLERERVPILRRLSVLISRRRSSDSEKF